MLETPRVQIYTAPTPHSCNPRLTESEPLREELRNLFKKLSRLGSRDAVEKGAKVLEALIFKVNLSTDMWIPTGFKDLGVE